MFVGLVLCIISVFAISTLFFRHGSSLWHKTYAQNQNRLTLEISTSKVEYLQLEPIPLTLKLSNQTNNPINWNGNLDFGENIEFLVKPINSNEIRVKNRSVETPIMNTKTILPDKEIVKQNLMDGESAERLLRQPGQYQMKIEFNYIDFSNSERQNVTITSNPIIIIIAAPNGNNLQAYNYLKQVYEPVNNGGDINEIISKRKYFADNFESSIYWKYLTFRLAKTYLLINKYAEAEQEFYRISDLDFFYDKEIAEQLQSLSRKLGRPIPRSKRSLNLNNVPVAVPIPVPTIYNGSPINPPVLIPIPNPVVNPSPAIVSNPLPASTPVANFE